MSLLEETRESTERLTTSNLLLINAMGSMMGSTREMASSVKPLNQSMVKLTATMVKLTIEIRTRLNLIAKVLGRIPVMFSKQIQEATFPIVNSMSNLSLQLVRLGQIMVSTVSRRKGIVKMRAALLKDMDERYHKSWSIDQFKIESLNIRRRWIKEMRDITSKSLFRERQELVGRGYIGGRKKYEYGRVIPPAMVYQTHKIASADLLRGTNEMAKQMGKKQTEKGANALTKMMGATAKASVYAWIMQQFMELFESFMFALTPWEPLITTLAALIKYAITPEVVQMTKVMVIASKVMWEYRDVVRAVYQAMNNAVLPPQNVVGVMEGLASVFEWWIKIFFRMDYILIGGSLVPAFERFDSVLSALMSPFDTFVGLFGDFKDLIENFKFPSLPGGIGGNGGGDDDSDFCKLFPWLCAQHGAYTGGYTGFMKVHPDEYIVPGDEYRAEDTGAYMQRLETNELLGVLIKQNKRVERRARMRT